MKTLKCIGCKSHVVVSDGTIGYCATCKIELQEDKRLDKELGLTKDKPIKATKTKKAKKQSKTKHKKSKKKKQ
jgi:hypothetical protein